MKTKKWGRVMAALLSLIMCLSMMPMTAFAEAGEVDINAANFPDNNFRSYVSSFDADSDGSLSETELAAVTEIKCSAKFISSLEGIEHFKALTYLDCSWTDLTTLDVSSNPALTELDCSYTDLTTLDVSSSPALTKLNCSGNHLTTLDVSSNPALTTLHCDYNDLTTLDVSSNPALTELRCHKNQLKTLDVSSNPALTELHCFGNQFTTLDVSSNPALTTLWCSANQLTALDVSGSTALKQLNCNYNQLKTLDVSGNPALTFLDCSWNNLTTLDVSGNTALTGLLCYDNDLTTLDVSNVPALKDAVINGILKTEFGTDYYESDLGGLRVDRGLKPITEGSVTPPAPTTYTVTIAPTTNGSVTADKTSDLAAADTVTLTVTPDSGYVLDELIVKDEETNLVAVSGNTFTMPAANVNVSATFKEKTVVPVEHNIHINPMLNGSVTSDKDKATEGEKVELAVTPDPGYELESLHVIYGMGAEVTLNADHSFTMPDADVVVNASFKEKVPATIYHTVIFDNNGHGTATSDQTVEDGKTVTKPSDLTESGWTFDGWYIDEECTNAFDFATPITEDTTLHAKWTENEVTPVPPVIYAITYNLNGGTLEGNTGIITVPIADGTIITLPKPTRTGYTFDYWEGSRYEAGASYKVEGDHTFTAQWKANDATTNQSGDGEVTSAITDNGKDGDNGTDGKVSSAITNQSIGKKTAFPKTGDESKFSLWFALMTLALTGLSGMRVYGSKKKENR